MTKLLGYVISVGAFAGIVYAAGYAWKNSQK